MKSLTLKEPNGCGLLIYILLTATGIAQEGASRTLVDFSRDVKPILESKCIECHGPKQAKNDFRVDDSTTLLSYIEAGDLQASSLWTDYLSTSDEEMLMPPVKHGKPLTVGQLATLKLWIEEGAQWPAGVMVLPPEESTTTVKPQGLISDTRSHSEKVKALLGLFHPAVVHFPIALLLISLLFLIGSYFKPDAFGAAAYHCLWIGALSAVPACTMGWFLAESQGYRNLMGWSLETGLDRHRTTAIIVTILSLLLIPVATMARKQQKRSMYVAWFSGALIIAGLVGIVGHQGGELVKGEQVFDDAYKAVFESKEK